MFLKVFKRVTKKQHLKSEIFLECFSLIKGFYERTNKRNKIQKFWLYDSRKRKTKSETLVDFPPVFQRGKATHFRAENVTKKTVQLFEIPGSIYHNACIWEYKNHRKREKFARKKTDDGIGKTRCARNEKESNFYEPKV